MTASPPDPLPMDDALREPRDESTAESSDDEARWPTPRGPHLPEALGVLPIVAWIFVLLALARLAWGLREAGFGSVIDPWRVGQVVLFGLPSIVSILLPAALLTRHRDARSRAPALVVGVILLAVVEGLRLLATPLEPVFEAVTPGDPAVSFLVPSALVYQVTINLLNAGAVFAIGLGLARARRFEDRSSSWQVAAVLASLVVLIAITGIVSVSQLPFEQLPLTPTVVAYIVSTVVLNVVSAMAFGYLTAVSTAGARASEEPWLAWRAGAAGASLVIGSLALLGLVGLVQVTPDIAALMNAVVQVIEAVFSLGFLGLLAAFVLGLPAFDPIDDENEDDAIDWDEAGDRPAGAESGVT